MTAKSKYELFWRYVRAGVFGLIVTFALVYTYRSVDGAARILEYLPFVERQARIIDQKEDGKAGDMADELRQYRRPDDFRERKDILNLMNK